MKKVFLALLCLVLLTVGCSKNDVSNSSEKKELTIWWWGDQEAPGAKKWMEETVKKFEDKNPNIKIKTVLQSTDNLIPAFKAAASSQQGPDIQYFWGGVYTLEDAWQGNIVPISDYIPKEELAHYINNSERTYDDKVWGASWYLSDNAMPYRKDVFKKAGLDPENPPKTWDEFLAACEKIKKSGFIPLTAGVKDGWLGGWIWQLLGKQTLDSNKDMLKVAVGEANYTDPKYSQWLDRLAELKEKGYINNDVTSLDYQQGQELFLQGKAAMILGNDTFFPKWIEQVGSENIGIANIPTYGTGAMADTVTVTAQGMGITSWSKHKKEAAKFIIYMHDNERLNAWYKDTGVFPADDRFDSSQISSPQMKQMFELVKTKSSVNLENFAPSILEEQAIFPGVQMILSGEKKPKQVAKDAEDALERWRKENPDAFENFKNWLKK
jgi:raffinose/stachyose/melibiose transport system substrate-binding protein